MTPNADLHPAERDPRKLRRTAWVLVGIMIVGGFLILKAYEKSAIRQSADDRPSIVSRIRKERDLRMIRQDGKTAELFELRGRVFAINVASIQSPEAGARSMAVMKRLAAKYASTPEFHLVTLVIDPMPADEAVALLSSKSTAEGITLPQWWIGGNEPATLHKFIKNELKADTFPHLEDGEWRFDTSIVLVDKNGHIRRAVVPQKQGGPPYVAPFDFDQAAKWDAEGKLTRTDRSNEAELELLLLKTIDTLLSEPAESP